MSVFHPFATPTLLAPTSGQDAAASEDGDEDEEGDVEFLADDDDDSNEMKNNTGRF